MALLDTLIKKIKALKEENRSLKKELKKLKNTEIEHKSKNSKNDRPSLF